MDKTTRKQNLTDAQAKHFPNQEIPIAAKWQGDGCGRRGRRVGGCGRVHTINLRASLLESSQQCSWNMIEAFFDRMWNWRGTSMDTDSRAVILAGSQPIMTQQSLTLELLKLNMNAVHNAMTEHLRSVGDFSVVENSQNDGSKRVKEERVRFLEEVNL